MSYNLKLIKKDFKDKGIFYTPKELAIFMKSFLRGDVKKIYDPTCGDGSLLENFEDDVIKFGQDINEEQINIANNKLINFNFYVGDTLKEPAFLNEKFDHIIANPPFSIKWEQNDKFKVNDALPPKSKADWAFMIHILNSLSYKGMAVVMNFPGVLYRGNSEGKIRKWFIENNYIEKVIFISGNKFVDTKIATCLIVLNKNKKNTDIVFIDSELEKEKTVSIKEIRKHDYNLSVSQYIWEEKVVKKIDALDLQKKAREQVIDNLKKDLEFDRNICEIEGWDFKEYINNIESFLRNYRKCL